MTRDRPIFTRFYIPWLGPLQLASGNSNIREQLSLLQLTMTIQTIISLAAERGVGNILHKTPEAA